MLFLLIRIKLTQLVRSLATIITKCFLLTLLNKGKVEDNRKGRGCEEGGGGVKDHWMFLGKLPTYPSPKPTLTLSYFSLRAKCWLRGGVGGQFPRNV